MVSVLDSGLIDLGLSPGRGTGFCSWALLQCISSPKCIFTAWGNPAMDKHRIQGRVEILLVTFRLCSKKNYKEPKGSKL